MTLPTLPTISGTDRYSYTNAVSAVTTLSLTFPVWGDKSDLDVRFAGVRQATTAYELKSPSGEIATLPRPLTDAYIEFSSRTGLIECWADFVPRRTSNLSESTGPTPREINLLALLLTATASELRTKIGRTDTALNAAMDALESDVAADIDALDDRVSTATGTANNAATSAAQSASAVAALQQALLDAVANIIPAGTLNGNAIQAGTLPSTAHATGAIAAGITDGSITAAKLAANAARDNVTNGSFPGAKIENGGIGTTQLADGSGTTAKHADESVTTAKLAAAAVTAAKADIASAANFRANTADKILVTDDTAAAGDEVTLTDAATIAVDGSTFVNGVVTLAGNRTLGAPTNLVVGRIYTIRVVQDATGSRTITWPAGWRWFGSVPTLSTAANAQDVLSFQLRAAGGVIVASLGKTVTS